MSHGGIGVIKSLDKEHGADDEKFESRPIFTANRVYG